MQLQAGVADVAQISHRRVQGPPVVLDQRQPPRPLAGCLAGGEQLPGEGVVGGEQPGVLLAERDGHGPGERRDVDDDIGIQDEVGVGEAVGEHQATLGVGVEHLDGAPAVLRDDVTRALGGAARHVLRHHGEHGEPERQA